MAGVNQPRQDEHDEDYPADDNDGKQVEFEFHIISFRFPSGPTGRAAAGNRTRDFVLTKNVLCQLSYSGRATLCGSICSAVSSVLRSSSGSARHRMTASRWPFILLRKRDACSACSNVASIRSISGTCCTFSIQSLYQKPGPRGRKPQENPRAGACLVPAGPDEYDPDDQDNQDDIAWNLGRQRVTREVYRRV